MNMTKNKVKKKKNRKRNVEWKENNRETRESTSGDTPMALFFNMNY